MQEFGPFRLVIALIWSSFSEASTHYLKMLVKGIIISLAVLLFIPIVEIYPESNMETFQHIMTHG